MSSKIPMVSVKKPGIIKNRAAIIKQKPLSISLNGVWSFLKQFIAEYNVEIPCSLTKYRPAAAVNKVASMVLKAPINQCLTWEH